MQCDIDYNQEPLDGWFIYIYDGSGNFALFVLSTFAIAQLQRELAILDTEPSVRIDFSDRQQQLLEHHVVLLQLRLLLILPFHL